MRNAERENHTSANYSSQSTGIDEDLQHLNRGGSSRRTSNPIGYENGGSRSSRKSSLSSSNRPMDASRDEKSINSTLLNTSRQPTIQRKPIERPNAVNDMTNDQSNQHPSNVNTISLLQQDRKVNMSPPISQTLVNESQNTKQDGITRSNQTNPVESIVHLGSTVHTEVRETMAPGMFIHHVVLTMIQLTVAIISAVIHENINKHVHHIIEERITREFHTHDVYYRTLPIQETIINPPRHFILSEDGKSLVEVAEDQIPGGATSQYKVVKTVADPPIVQSEHRPFVGIKFKPGAGDYKEYVDKNGVLQTERTVLHYPVLDDVSQKDRTGWHTFEFIHDQPRQDIDQASNTDSFVSVTE